MLPSASALMQRAGSPPIAPGSCSRLQHSLLQSASPLNVLGSPPIALGCCSSAAALFAAIGITTQCVGSLLIAPGRCSQLQHTCCHQHHHPACSLSADRARLLLSAAAHFAAISNASKRVRLTADRNRPLLTAAAHLLPSATPLSVLGSLPITQGCCSQLQHSLLQSASPLSVLAADDLARLLLSCAALSLAISNTNQCARLAADRARPLL